MIKKKAASRTRLRLSKKYTLILVLIFILQNIKDEYFSEWKYV